MTKRPAFQFYPGDWLRSTDLRSCSVGARGLWIDMICLMHEGDPYGHLKVNKKIITNSNLSRIVGASPGTVKKWLKELEDAGVFSITPEGCIYSRRMVKDEQVRRNRAAGGILGAEHGIKGREAGYRGGRPKSSRGDNNPPSKPPYNPPYNPPPASASAFADASYICTSGTANKSTYQENAEPKDAVDDVPEKPVPKKVSEVIPPPKPDDPEYEIQKELHLMALKMDAAGSGNGNYFEGAVLKIPLKTWEIWLENLGLLPAQLAQACAILDLEMAAKTKPIRYPVSYASKVLLQKSQDGSLHTWMRRCKPAKLDVSKYTRGRV